MDFALVERELSTLVKPGDPGMAFGVYRDGAAVFTAAQGVACAEFGVPIDARTRFDIASSSKQFTAACVLLLARDGAFGLDDDVRTLIPGLSLAVPVTVRQLLQHTGGLPEWYALTPLSGLAFTEMTEERLLRQLKGIRRTNFPPGTDFSYSNTGYVLAAVLVREVTGKSLAAFADERIFKPLGMDDTVFRDDPSVPLPRMAYGYATDSGEPRRADTMEAAVGDGGVVTSVRDLAPWFGFLADGRVLGVDLRDALVEQAVLDDGTVLPYAFGVYHGEVAGQACFGHGGKMHGYTCDLLFFPAAGLGVALLTNQTAVNPSQAGEHLVHLLLGAPPAAVSPAGTTPGGEVPVGHWHDPATDEVFTVTTAEDGGMDVYWHGITLRFTEGTDGDWHGTGPASGTRLAAEGGRLTFHPLIRSRRPTVLVPCRAPDPAPMPDAVYLSEELGVLATVAGGTLHVGLSLRLPIEPGPAGAWRAGPYTLRLDSGDLLVSGGGLRGFRLTGQPAGTRAIGVPR
ncbi:serine hydrolase domain-containing protein [Rhizohabitans arisaemae]|uniref:serine hydrolase domain-containing protein n=1 Tax=Rhizohabitans arisaemae TaxID=2720610 RepID=UPI0024B27F19|nr:serine hydrolase domain-containing protein [Rhizohabitans arisaemae]